MIIQNIIEDGRRIRQYSDNNYKLIQNETGVLYDDAVDMLPCRYTYSETDRIIEMSETDEINRQTGFSESEYDQI